LFSFLSLRLHFSTILRITDNRFAKNLMLKFCRVSFK
jgi:hypothetical protein